MIGLGKTKVSTTRPANPANHIHGAIAAIARPPSSGTTGTRLNRLRKKPVKPSASQNSLPVAAPISAHASAPREPSTGPARPTRASASASLPSDLAATTAPRNGMNIGALDLMPSRRSWMTCPISCTRSRSTNPTAKLQPQKSADEEQGDGPHGDAPAPEERVRGDRDQHRRRGGQQLDLRQQEHSALTFVAN